MFSSFLMVALLSSSQIQGEWVWGPYSMSGDNFTAQAQETMRLLEGGAYTESGTARYRFEPGVEVQIEVEASGTWAFEDGILSVAVESAKVVRAAPEILPLEELQKGLDLGRERTPVVKSRIETNDSGFSRTLVKPFSRIESSSAQCRRP